MKKITVEVRKSEYVGGVLLRLPEEGELKWVGWWDPADSYQRYYDYLVPSKSMLRQDGRNWDNNWISLHSIVYDNLRQRLTRDVAKRLKYIFLSVGYTDGRRRIYALPSLAIIEADENLTPDASSSMDIFEISWDEFRELHEETYQAYKDALYEDVRNGKFTGIIGHIYTCILRWEDKKQLRKFKRRLQEGKEE